MNYIKTHIACSSVLMISNLYTGMKRETMCDHSNVDRFCMVFILSLTKSFIFSNPHLLLPNLVYKSAKAIENNDINYFAPLFIYKASSKTLENNKYKKYCLLNQNIY
jgi:hypothetical protein